MRVRALSVPVLAVLIAGSSLAQAAPRPAAPAADRGEAMRALRRDAVAETIRTRPDGTISFFTGRVPGVRFSTGGGDETRANDFLRAYGPALGIRRSDAVKVRSSRDALGMTHVRYEQRYRGIPVVGRQVIVHLQGGDVVAANGDAVGEIDVSTRPTVTAEEASVTASRALRRRDPSRARTEPELVVFADAGRVAHLAWQVTTPASDPFGLWRTYVDATTGRIIRSRDLLQYAKSRQIYDMGTDPGCNTSVGAPDCALPGTLARGESDPATGDPAEDSLHTRLGEAYDYFFTTFGLDSYDGSGHAIRASAHFGEDFANAFWCPDACAAEYDSTLGVDGEQLAFGDGDGTVFGSLAEDPDVVLHEFVHGVTSAHVGFAGFDQNGALDESYADLFAAFESGDWRLGETSFTPGGVGHPNDDELRNLGNPAVNGDPDHMNDFVQTAFDGGGVHRNSLIPSHAAYMISEDGVSGLGEAVTEQIYFRALTQYLTPSATFLDNLNALITSASDLHGTNSPEVEAVVEGHAAVGIMNAVDISAPLGGAALKGGTSTEVSWDPSGTDGQTFTASYGRASGSGVYRQAFEGTSLPSGFSSPSGTTAWAPTTASGTVYSGSRSLRSGDVGDDGVSALTMTRDVLAPGTIEFIYRVSSEEGFDWFSFFIDDVLVGVDTGYATEALWQLASIEVPAGRHTFTWMFEKDEIDLDPTGLDGVIIDDLVLTNTPSITWQSIGTTGADATSIDWTPPTTTGTTYRVRVQTVAATQGFGEVIAGPFTVDATAPKGVGIKSSLPAFQVKAVRTRAAFTVPWTAGSDAHSGITSYDVRWRPGYTDGTFEPFSALIERTTRTSYLAEFEVAPSSHLGGVTFCFGARARDAVGNVSSYSSSRCTAVPLDVLQLPLATSGWTVKTGQSGYYMRTYAQTKLQGAGLRSSSVKAKRIALIATRCPDCGTIKVFRGSTLLKKVSLRASKLRKRQVIPIKTFSRIVSAKPITIRVVSSGRVVRIEGLGISIG